jgi:hypothetical protein
MTKAKATWLDPEVERGVVFEVLVHVDDLEHVEECEAPLYCALGFGSNCVVITGVGREAEDGSVFPVQLPGLVLRVRVNDGEWLAATSDRDAYAKALGWDDADETPEDGGAR